MIGAAWRKIKVAAQAEPVITLDTDADHIVRGSAFRAAGVMGAVSAVCAVLAATALWLLDHRDPFSTKVIVTLAMFGCVGIVTLAATIAAVSAVARVRDGRITFSFCGVQTRSIPLDTTTAFQICTFGQMRGLVIISGRKRYVPNGALDHGAVMELLRRSGVTELPGQN